MTTNPRALPHGELRIGLLGLGTVASGVAEILSRHPTLIAARAGVPLRLVRALVRSRRRRGGAAGKVPVCRRPEDIVAAPDIDIVVELMGGQEPARSLMAQALTAGKSVVTANKAVLALHGATLFAAAARHGADVYFEAAVAGGIPIIRTLREGLAGDRILRLRGILNGTTNYILGRLGAGEPYAEALAAAQRQGFAEADPTLDVNGRDAADKLAILLQLAFGTQVTPDVLPCDGIDTLTPAVVADAAELGRVVKLVAYAERIVVGQKERIAAGVHPTLVAQSDVLAHVPASQNAVAVHSEALGNSLYQGPGAGSLPTGSAVVADLIEAARNLRAGVSGRLHQTAVRAAPRLLKAADMPGAFYLRLLVDDKPGVLARIAEVLGDAGISMASVLQQDRGARAVPLVITTHGTTQGALKRALSRIDRMAALHERAPVLRLA